MDAFFFLERDYGCRKSPRARYRARAAALKAVL